MPGSLDDFLERRYQELLIKKHNERMEVLNKKKAQEREAERAAEAAYLEALARTLPHPTPESEMR